MLLQIRYISYPPTAHGKEMESTEFKIYFKEISTLHA